MDYKKNTQLGIFISFRNKCKSTLGFARKKERQLSPKTPFTFDSIRSQCVKLQPLKVKMPSNMNNKL